MMGSFATEAFLLLAIGLVVILLRSYARTSSVGFRGLQADDYLMLLAAVVYSAQIALTYSVSASWDGLANNSMTDEQRRNLDPESKEYMMRVNGSKALVAGWSTYIFLLWILKAAMCTFFLRLTDGLDYTRPIYIGFGLIIATWIAAQCSIIFSCYPIKDNWQIFPDPGNACQPAVSRPDIVTNVVLDILTNLYLLYLPIPILYRASIKPFKKASLIILLSGGIFVIVGSIVRSVLITSNPDTAAEQAGAWACRETFVAVITTNLPMLIPLVRAWYLPLARYMSADGARGQDKMGGFRLEDKNPRKGMGAKSPYPLPAFTESEERIYQAGVPMRSPTWSRARSPAWSIAVKKEVRVEIQPRPLTPAGDSIQKEDSMTDVEGYPVDRTQRKESGDLRRMYKGRESRWSMAWSVFSGPTGKD